MMAKSTAIDGMSVTEKTPALSVRGLGKTFGGVAAVRDLSFEMQAGSISALIGPNGAGKTTVFNLITGVYRADGGQIVVDGQDVSGRGQHEIARCGVARTFQTPQIFFNMSAVENVMVGASEFLDQNPLWAILRGARLTAADRDCKASAEALMQRLGLGQYCRSEPGAMPYGALKRLEIARALASRPRILFLDEPAAGLTALERVQMMELIRGLSSDGPTIVLVEHDMKLVMNLAAHVFVLVQGALLAEGTPETITADKRVIDAYLGADHER